MIGEPNRNARENLLPSEQDETMRRAYLYISQDPIISISQPRGNISLILQVSGGP